MGADRIDAPKSPVNLYALKFDVSDLASLLVQLVSRAGLKTTQDGYGEVGQEIRDNYEIWGNKAGVTADDINTLDTCDQTIDKIDLFLPTIGYIYEVMLDTRYDADDRRQRTVLAIAQGVDRRIRKAPELETRYAKTRAYRSATAKKALRTRRRNEAESGTPTPPKGTKPKAKKQATRRSGRATKAKSLAAGGAAAATSTASE